MEADLNKVNLSQVISQLSEQKGVARSSLVEAIEQATLAAARRAFGSDRKLEARYNEDTGVVDVFQIFRVVEVVTRPRQEIRLEEARARGLVADLDDELLFPIFYRTEDAEKAAVQDRQFGDLLGLTQVHENFGRIAAQTAKQALYVRVRAAERENIYRMYKDREGELVSGTVRRLERGNLYVELEHAEALLPWREQVPRESYRVGDQLLAYVLRVEGDAKGAQIVLSRTHKGLVEKLFARHVPEIQAGIVRIEASAREAGERSKIAVSSSDENVDPVGVCVGPRGARVQSVGRELRGEKIDVLPFDSDPAHLASNALSPAQVSRILLDPEGQHMALVVPDGTRAAALGKKGQNVRLAAELTGWKLEVHTESEIKERETRERAAMAALPEVGEQGAEALFRLGWRTMADLAASPPEELAAIPEFGGLEIAQRISLLARQAVESERQKAAGQKGAQGSGEMRGNKKPPRTATPKSPRQAA